MKAILWACALGGLLGCANSRLQRYDPCREMLEEVKNGRNIGKRLQLLERQIVADSMAGETAALKGARARRERLRQQAYYSKVAGEELGAECSARPENGTSPD